MVYALKGRKMVADTVAQAMAWLRAWVITPALEHFVALQASQIEERHEVLAKARPMPAILPPQKQLQPSILHINSEARWLRRTAREHYGIPH